MPNEHFEASADETQTLWRLMADKVPGVLWSTDGALRFTTSFGSGLAALGLKPGEVVGRTVFEYFGTEDKDFPPIAAHRRALAGQPVAYEQAWQDRTFEVHLAPLRGEDDRVAGVVGVAQDITSRKQAEVALREARDALERRVAERTADLELANAELQAIYDGMADGVLIADLETRRFVRANAAICRMLGRDEEELLGLTVAGIHPPEHLADFLERFLALAERRMQVAGDTPLLRKDGTVFFADITGQRISYGGRPCIIGFFCDVTERRRAEEALRASEARYRELIENVNSIILRMDVHGNITFFNRYAESFFGWSREEILGRNSVGTIVPPEESSGRDLREMVRHIGEHPEEHASNENENIRRDGTRVWVSWTNRAVRDAGGRVVGILCVGNDITKRVRAEEALHREQRVLRRLLESHERERKLVAYEIHDGLAQLLTGANMHLQIYQSGRGQDPEASAKALAALQDLLAQSMVEVRRLISGLRPPVLDESGALRAIEHLVRETAAQGGPEVQLQVAVEFDRLEPLLENAVFRIVQESLTNARRYSRADKVRIRLRQRGDRLRIEVRDWGAGFDPKQVGGQCFGLRGIRERARVLGGKAAIRSAPGQGTRVSVELPLAVR